MSDTILEQPNGLARVAAATFWRAGLLLPPLPRELAGALDQFGPMAFGTFMGDAADRGDWLARARDPASVSGVAMDHSGYGVNSYALSYQLILPALAVFFRVPFGGIYADQAEQARRFNAIVERLEQLVILAEAAARAGRIAKSHRLVVAIDDRDGGGWEIAPDGVWVDSEHPIEDAMRSLRGQ